MDFAIHLTRALELGVTALLQDGERKRRLGEVFFLKKKADTVV